MRSLSGETVTLGTGEKVELDEHAYACRSCGGPVRILPGSKLGAVHVVNEDAQACPMEGELPGYLKGELKA